VNNYNGVFLTDHLFGPKLGAAKHARQITARFRPSVAPLRYLLRWHTISRLHRFSVIPIGRAHLSDVLDCGVLDCRLVVERRHPADYLQA
jgi:hypothetical protein